MAKVGGNPQNLKSFTKGVSGNPAGKKKGSRNRATIVRQWLNAKDKYVNPITKKEELLELVDIITINLIRKARGGDVAAFNTLMDSAYGKIVDKVAETDSEGNDKQPKPNYENLTTDELIKLKELTDKCAT